MTLASTRPIPLPVLPNNIPAELKVRRQWVLWRYTWSDAKTAWDKPPLTRSAHRASSTDSSTWCSYVEAVEAYEAGAFDGIGFVFTKDDDFLGIDLDDCRDPSTGELFGWTTEQCDSLPTGFPVPRDIVRCAASYFEASPSGTGVKGIVRAGGAKGTRMGPVEIYPHGRYFTITGHRLDDVPVEIRDAQPFIDAVVARIELTRSAKNTKPKGMKSTTAVQPVADDHELLAVAFAARNGAKVRDLFEGRWQSYFPAAAGPSEADLALCSELAFWTGPVAGRVDGLFRQSALLRDKWDEVHDGEGHTYGQMTIATALAGKTDFYDWSRTAQQEQAPLTIAVGTLELLPGRPAVSASGKLTVNVDVLDNGEVVGLLTVSSSAHGLREAVKQLLRLLPEEHRDATAAAKAVDQTLVLCRKQLLESSGLPDGITILELLRAEVLRRWKLTHRDQHGLWSEELGRSINRNTLLELVVCTEILNRAAECIDAPHDNRGELQHDRIQAVVEKNAKVMYADLMGSLPTLEQTCLIGDVEPRVKQRLRALFIEAWTKPQTMGIVRRPTTDKNSVQLMERTSFAQKIRDDVYRPQSGDPVAGPSQWAPVQSGYSAWWRVHRRADGRSEVWLAMRFDLFAAAHVSLAEFGIMDQRSLTTIGRKLGLLSEGPPVPETIGHQKTRVAVLAREVVAEIVFDTHFEAPTAGAEKGAPAP